MIIAVGGMTVLTGDVTVDMGGDVTGVERVLIDPVLDCGRPGVPD
jgi:hypothetical protein